MEWNTGIGFKYMFCGLVHFAVLPIILKAFVQVVQVTRPCIVHKPYLPTIQGFPGSSRDLKCDPRDFDLRSRDPGILAMIQGSRSCRNFVTTFFLNGFEQKDKVQGRVVT